MLVRMLPQILFALFALWIVLATVIRGHNEYDLTGHPYMYESIYSYICYALVYFFCGTVLFRSSHKRILLYALIFTALPINVLALVNEWFTAIRYFNGRKVCAVFHNSNHYGYYLVMVIIASAILFVYEKKLIWRAVDAVSAIIGTMVLVINNTFGAFLSVLIVLISFAVYAFLKDRTYFKRALLVLGGYLLVIFVMSFWYSTIFSSITTFSKDLMNIAADPLEADNAGSHRWALWKGTVKHLPESPFTGFGVEGLLNTYYIGTPHNELLQYAEFFGIPAALLYLSAVVFVIASVMKHSRKLSKMTLVCFCVSVGYFASSMFGCAIYYTTPFFYIFLGLTYAELFRGKPAAPPEEKTQ